MSKTAIFIILSVIAAVFGIFAFQNDASFRITIWSQLFWLAVGTIATTFLLNAILERNIASRRRKEDQFGFRTVTSFILSSILVMLKAGDSKLNELESAALETNQKLAEAAANTNTLVAQLIGQKPISVDPISYDLHYQDIGSHLRDLAHRYIRLFSKDRQEMVDHYQNLQDLARRWRYRGAFTERTIVYTLSLKPDDAYRKENEKEFAREMRVVKKLVTETSTYLADLANRVANTPGIPAVS